jgi:hypothetical protein
MQGGGPWLFANHICGYFVSHIFVLFIRIIKGNPEELESEMMQGLAAWIMTRGPRAKGQLLVMLFLSLLAEAGYFIMVFLTLDNLFMLLFTCFFAGYEILHLLLLTFNLYRFFKGRLKLKEIFVWKAERFSALLFFTQTLLVMIVLGFL